MVKLEGVTIRNLRGIRSLSLNFARKNFVVYGPNGSGKSGVIDAIQFGLTGRISRLIGRGTGQLTFQKYGPHVDSRDNISAVEVSLKLYFPSLGKTIVLRRNAENPKTFVLDPEDSDAQAIVEELARFPKLALSRREIIEYIVVEAGERAKQIQALLKIEEINDLRSILLKSRNQAKRSFDSKQGRKKSAQRDFLNHLDLTTMSSEKILHAINEQREVLSLPPISELENGETLSSGINQGERRNTFNKATALRDIQKFQDHLREYRESSREEVEAILEAIGTLDSDPSLLEMFQKKELIERGLHLVDGPQCPLCDKDWEDEETLLAHLRTKISKLEQVKDIQQAILGNARVIAGRIQQFVSLLDLVYKLALRDGPEGLAYKLKGWAEDLTKFKNGLTTANEVISGRLRLEQDWMSEPRRVSTDITQLAAAIKDKPDQTSTADAHSFLILAKERYDKYLEADQNEKSARTAAEIGQLVYDSYLKVSKKRLKKLYETVEANFSEYYRMLNGDDESGFRASLEPIQSKLNLEVAFYDRGDFPPAAYHSEGHQDGMGVCLYLALMKQLMGSSFSVAMLDDVVMSIDQQHRKQFCRLLKNHFPGTQFIITTHDKVWAKQMQTESLVTSEGRINFHRWSVQTGPIHEKAGDVWDDVNDDLAKQDISAAAGKLRHHSEYIFEELADRLGAKVPYRSDHAYELGTLFGAVIGRHGELLRLAEKSAKSWNKDAKLQEIQNLKRARSELLTRHGKENWLVNKAIHYNMWANFSEPEFREVVVAFKELLQQFQCPQCDSWLYITPRIYVPESLRCDCAEVSMNLKSK